jgi:hypothetical protein
VPDRTSTSRIQAHHTLIVPVLVLIYFGTAEITSLMRNLRKIDILSCTIGDTLSQRTMPTAAEVNDVFQVAPIILAPFDSTRVRMTVSAVGVLGDAETGPLQVCSSLASAGAPVRTAGAAAPVADADSLQPKGTRFLLIEISTTYYAGDRFSLLQGWRGLRHHPQDPVAGPLRPALREHEPGGRPREWRLLPAALNGRTGSKLSREAARR